MTTEQSLYIQEYATPDAIRGLNHALTAVLHMTKHSDPPEIITKLEQAANLLYALSKKYPIENNLLDVDFWVHDDE